MKNSRMVNAISRPPSREWGGGGGAAFPGEPSNDM
jgi:hypothetical protein